LLYSIKRSTWEWLEHGEDFEIWICNAVWLSSIFFLHSERN
jgi:hypothetical protein